MERLQRTIADTVKISGVGIHTGAKVNLTLKPALENSGINFVRVDLPGAPSVQAESRNLIEPRNSIRRTSIGANGAEVYTIEHLMSVLSGLGIDNLIVEIDNVEIPAMDGSGAEFLNILKKAGIKEQATPKKVYVITEPVWVEEGDSMIMVLPAKEFSISDALNYDHPLLKSQFIDLALNEKSFESEIASSRTFCLEDEAKALREKGLGKGANYDNTLVVGKNGVIKNNLRFPDEFARHKVLDLIGDLFVFGQLVLGRIVAIRSGHSLNLKLVKKIQEQKERVGLNGKVLEGSEVLDSTAIMNILPHRFPFLLVDRIIHLERGKRAVGIKNVTINEDFFNGHFPGKPIMPGVLIIEAMAQVGGVMMLAGGENKGKLVFFLAINNVKFRKTVLPGDTLVIEVEAGRIKSKTGEVKARAYVDGKLTTEGELMFAIVEV